MSKNNIFLKRRKKLKQKKREGSLIMRRWKNLPLFSILVLFAFVFGCSPETQEKTKTLQTGTATTPVQSESPNQKTDLSRKNDPNQSAKSSDSIKVPSQKILPSQQLSEKTDIKKQSEQLPAEALSVKKNAESEKNIDLETNANSETNAELKTNVNSETNAVSDRNRSDQDLTPPASWDPDNINDPFRKAILARAEKKWNNAKLFPAVNDTDAAAQGIRVLCGKKIILYTDFPSSPFIDEIPLILGMAKDRLAEYFKIDPSALDSFKIDAFLIRDKARFQRLGVFNGVPEFENGYSILNRVYALEQNTDYYNRFLLIHELTHSFMFRFFGDLAPRWYIEGMAEYLALNRHENKRFDLGILPNHPEEVAGFGRIQNLQKLVRENAILSPEKIFNFIPTDYKNVENYGWSWAMTIFLTHHPIYGKEMRKLPYLMMDQQVMSHLNEIIQKDKNRFLFEWFLFIRSFDFGYDFKANAIEFRDGHSFTEKTDLDLSANQAWLSSGLKLKKGQKYRIRAVGRFEIYDERGVLPCEPNGITLRYYQGEPLGKLLGTILTEDSSSRENFPEILAIGSQLYFTPKETGTLYFRVNCSAEELKKNKGIFKVRVEPETDDSNKNDH